MTDLLTLPPDLPVPIDDGAADHLAGVEVPDVRLLSTAGRFVSLADATGISVVFCYPRTARPGEPVPAEWDAIAGARGCTVEACSFRDHHGALMECGASLYGVSTQPAAEQAEAAGRVHLPFELLSDASLALTERLGLPTFEFEGRRLLKRLTLVVDGGRITHVFYPVFPPDRHPAEVLAYLRGRGA